ncbi:MAG: hypothetical protein IPL64_09970 [Flavobacteriales bacterium]|nr:hypothetical protein [Flavobacteriales bacterium]
MKWPLFLLFILPTFALFAQPDTLWVPDHGVLKPYGVTYDPVRMDAQYKRIGRFVQDTGRIAVEMDYKRGFPSGVFRAFYPDGRPLIFAVYGWKTLHGDWTEYAEDGSVSLKGQYRQGLRDGPWAFRKDEVLGHYKKGQKHGEWKYYANGITIRTEKYKRGSLKRKRNFDRN